MPHPRHTAIANYKKCDETAKKRDELVTGAFFRVEKGAHGSAFARLRRDKFHTDKRQEKKANDHAET